MVWHLGFQVAGLILTLVILYFSYSQRRLLFKAEKAFNSVLLNVLICNVFDVLAAVSINYRETLGEGVCEFFCECLLISICSVACHAAWFAVDEIRATYRKIVRLSTIIPCFVTIIACILFDTVPYVSVEKSEIFFSGIPDTITFILCMLYVVSGLIMVVKRRRQVNRDRRFTIYSWHIIWTFAGLFQRVFPQFSIVGFSTSLACLFMYCKLENPDQNMDSVNGIFNQKALQIKLEEILVEDDHKSIVNFAVSNMSVITEIFGSNILNRLVKEICQYAKSFPNTTAFRLEDNVFSIIVSNKEDLDGILDNVAARFDSHWEIKGIQINVNAIVSYIEDVTIFSDIASVEEAIHFFSLEGRKNPGQIISIDIDEVEKRKKKIETQHALDWALRNNGVEVFYQPIYNIEKGYFTAMEALVRIRDEKGTLIFPNDFIDYAEKNGMILQLGEEIFRNVCEFIRRSKIEQYGIEFIDVNLSVVQCMQEDLAKVFKNILGEYQVPPYMVNLEITETAAIASQKTLNINMMELIDYGISFSLDDYGSGYSNLTYIVSLPVSIIKIDREITINYRNSEKARIATDSTINMIHNLGMDIIVEGVEDEEQYADFRDLGVNLIQGYYFSKPLPAKEIIPFLQKWL